MDVITVEKLDISLETAQNQVIEDLEEVIEIEVIEVEEVLETIEVEEVIEMIEEEMVVVEMEVEIIEMVEEMAIDKRQILVILAETKVKI